MSIPEYYLHMFGSVNGDNDQYTGAGRIMIAALMGGYGLSTTTKKDLQVRVNWSQTPGCFLGQKLIADNAWSVRNNPTLKTILTLVEVRKASRVMSYTLNWNALLADDLDFRITSGIWGAIAKIYWMGRFLFGRNVIPEDILTSLKSNFNYAIGPEDGLRNLYNAFVMQFFYDNGFFAKPMPRGTAIEGYMPASEIEITQTRIPRELIFLSLALSINYAENPTGFLAACAYIPCALTRGQSFNEMPNVMRRFDDARSRSERNYSMPFCSVNGSQFNLYNSSMHLIEGPDSRWPRSMREIIPLLLCDTELTPQQEVANGYSPSYARFNPQLLGKNMCSYVSGALLYEYHLLLTGREIVPLDVIKRVRVEKGWDEPMLSEAAQTMAPFAQRNCTTWRILEFHLARQNQV